MLFAPPTESLKNFGEKTVGLFESKETDAEKAAADKKAEAKNLAKKEAEKLDEAMDKTKEEADGLAASTGEHLGVGF